MLFWILFRKLFIWIQLLPRSKEHCLLCATADTFLSATSSVCANLVIIESMTTGLQCSYGVKHKEIVQSLFTLPQVVPNCFLFFFFPSGSWIRQWFCQFPKRTKSFNSITVPTLLRTDWTLNCYFLIIFCPKPLKLPHVYGQICNCSAGIMPLNKSKWL